MREREETTWTAEWNILRMSLKIRFPDFDLSSLDWSELDEFYKDHPEEIPIENEFVGYRADGDMVEDFKGNLYLILCDPGHASDRKQRHETIRTGWGCKTWKTDCLRRRAAGSYTGIITLCRKLTQKQENEIRVNH